MVWLTVCTYPLLFHGHTLGWPLANFGWQLSGVDLVWRTVPDGKLSQQANFIVKTPRMRGIGQLLEETPHPLRRLPLSVIDSLFFILISVLTFFPLRWTELISVLKLPILPKSYSLQLAALRYEGSQLGGYWRGQGTGCGWGEGWKGMKDAIDADTSFIIMWLWKRPWSLVWEMVQDQGAN